MQNRRPIAQMKKAKPAGITLRIPSNVCAGFKLPDPQRGPRKVKTSIARLVSKAGVSRSRKGLGHSLRLSTFPLDHRTPRQLLASACRHRARREGRAVSRCATFGLRNRARRCCERAAVGRGPQRDLDHEYPISSCRARWCLGYERTSSRLLWYLDAATSNSGASERSPQSICVGTRDLTP